MRWSYRLYLKGWANIMEFKRILVSVDGAKTDEDAIELACRLARQSKGKVYVTYVIRLNRTLPLNAEVKPEVDKGEMVLDAAERFAEKCHYDVHTDLLQARAVGPALVNEATERGVDLMIIGVGYNTRFGEFDVGELVPYVMKNAPCRVILLREPVSMKVGAKR